MLAMSPNGRSWQVLTWSWACSTGDPAYDQVLEAAANAAWPYALLCAWTFLNDRDAAHDLMDHAIQNATEYIARHPDTTLRKVSARVKSVIRRQAKTLANRRKHESSYGSLADFEAIDASHSDIEQRIYANEVFAHLSLFAQAIVNRRWLGYSWREIGRDLEMDYSEVRRAYFRELRSLMQNLSCPGDSAKCD
jgi:DNA-directed RNA polymerase specialized sigma24 family protein